MIMTIIASLIIMTQEFNKIVKNNNHILDKSPLPRRPPKKSPELLAAGPPGVASMLSRSEEPGLVLAPLRGLWGLVLFQGVQGLYYKGSFKGSIGCGVQGLGLRAQCFFQGGQGLCCKGYFKGSIGLGFMEFIGFRAYRVQGFGFRVYRVYGVGRASTADRAYEAYGHYGVINRVYKVYRVYRVLGLQGFVFRAQALGVPLRVPFGAEFQGFYEGPS